MKNIKQLQAVLINKDDFDYTKEDKDIKNVWYLMNIVTSDTVIDDYGHFKVTLSPDIAGMVFRYTDDRMECRLNSLSFQDEYNEGELKEIIISDILDEYGDLFLPEYLVSDINVLSIMWDKLSTEMRSLVTNIIGIRYGKKAEEKLNNRVCGKYAMRDVIKFERVISEQINTIKKFDKIMTNLKKETDGLWEE